MWLTSSSVGRKFVMALTGAALVLFVTFHCVMNSVAILWPTAYNLVCEFLGANWYALVASAGLAALIVIHIIYAVWLTIQNRRARGNNRYALTSRPKSVEWSSKNMLVLGIVILAFIGIHMWQFWAKMQLAEVCGEEGPFPAAAGTLFLSMAFEQVWTVCVYVVAFIALWFHLTHGFWSMFQSVGWDSTRWIPRLKCIGWWWASIVCILFIAEAGVFTYRAMDGYYYNNEALRAQYAEMIGGELNEYAEYDQKDMFNSELSFDQLVTNVNAELGAVSDPEAKAEERTPQAELFIKKLEAAQIHLNNILNGGICTENATCTATKTTCTGDKANCTGDEATCPNAKGAAEVTEGAAEVAEGTAVVTVDTDPTVEAVEETAVIETEKQ